MDNRNAYMLKGVLAKRGYDWWWHSLIGVDRKTGERQPFFIEYFIVNPKRGGKESARPDASKKGVSQGAGARVRRLP